ncbi:MAG: HAD family hydrolase [Bacteroidales bacterium]|nr:HAD family hydrolase [Bacteroidales bacterium]MCF8456358.1 HAD family hydrolase [Bacteroidales bacterium]
MEKAVFFDRDGVINNDTGHYYIHRVEDFQFNLGVIEAMKLLVEADFRLIIISNQGGISKGIFKKEDTERVHLFMLDELKKHNIFLDEIYYCPHHSDIENCLCRKPCSIMIEKALARFSIDPRKSYLIGDSPRDIEAGKKAGLTCFLVDKNENIFDLCKSILAK